MKYDMISQNRRMAMKYEWVMIVLIAVALWFGVSKFVFEIRNPLSNETAFFTEFKSVVTFQKLDKFQPETYLDAKKARDATTTE